MMAANRYLAFFGLQKTPFTADLDLDQILATPDLKATADRLEYAIGLGAMAMITGEVGAGKSTALRWFAGRLHPSSHRLLWVTATSGSILEFYRQLLAELDLNTASSSRAVLTRLIKERIVELASRQKLQPVLVIDEASLLRLDVFAELHTITQFEGDSKPWLPIILAGQNNLADNLLYRTAVPLASRVVTRYHFQNVERQGMADYLEHHFKIAGLNTIPCRTTPSPPSTRAPADSSARPTTWPAALWSQHPVKKARRSPPITSGWPPLNFSEP